MQQAALPHPPAFFFHHLLRSFNLRDVYRPIIEYHEMFDEVWEVLLTCKVHMYTGYMLISCWCLYIYTRSDI